MSDATTQLGQSAAPNQSASDSSSMMGSINGAVGVLANYQQFLGIPGVITLIQNVLQQGPSTSTVLSELLSDVQELVSLSGALVTEVKMLSLNNFSDPAISDLEIITTELAKGPHVKPKTFFSDALQYVTAVSDTAYWYRPYVTQVVFQPEVLNNVALLSDPSKIGSQAGLTFPFTFGWYGNASWDQNLPGLAPPTDTQHIPGYSSVLDPQFIVPALASALECFLEINALLGQSNFDYVLSNYNSLLSSFADQLKELYATLIAGLVKSDVPTTDDVMGYLWIWANIDGKKLAQNQTLEVPCTWIQQPVNGPVQAGAPCHTGCAWNGIYGVVNLYGTVSGVPVATPSRAVSYMVDLFTTNGISDLPKAVPFLPGHAPYRWVHDKVSLGLMARWKALYLLAAYDELWAILQKLRRLLGQPADTRLQLPDGTVATEDWSVRELIGVLGLRPMWAQTYPTYAEQPWYSLFHVVQRLDLISQGTWTTPADDDAFDSDERINHTVVTKRPAGLRDRLAAAAV